MTEVVLNEPLSQVSLLFVSSALAFLALALVLFSFQLVKLSTVEAVSSEAKAASVGSTMVVEKIAADKNDRHGARGLYSALGFDRHLGSWSCAPRSCRWPSAMGKHVRVFHQRCFFDFVGLSNRSKNQGSALHCNLHCGLCPRHCFAAVSLFTSRSKPSCRRFRATGW